MSEKMSVSECAEQLGISAQLLRLLLQQGNFKEFAMTVTRKGQGRKNTYYINRSKFNQWKERK